MKKNTKHAVKKGNSKNKIIIILLLIIFALGVILFIFGNKTSSLFEKKAYIIVSGSMVPEINVGDIAIVQNTNQVKIGDIIAFKRQNKIIVHRIVNEMKVNKIIMYQTKGDSNNVEDSELVNINDIEGVYIGKIPRVGNILIWLSNNLFIMIIFAITFVSLIYYFIEKLKNNKTE